MKKIKGGIFGAQSATPKAQLIDGYYKVKLKLAKILGLVSTIGYHLDLPEQFLHTPTTLFCIPEDLMEARYILCANKVKKCMPRLLVYVEP